MRPQTSSSVLVALACALLFLSVPPPAAALDPPVFRRGDANADASTDISDAMATLGFLFMGGMRGSCDDAADANDDGRIDLSDAVSSLAFLFLGGPEPPSPGFACGPDPTPDDLGCEEYRPCGHLASLADPRLVEAGDCDEALDGLRQSLAEDMERTLAENLRFAMEWGRWGCWLEDAVPFLGPGPAPPPGEPSGADSASEHSGTNNQVEGVDEADFVKNDGAYIYIVADGRFQVIDAWPAPEAHRIASVAVEGEPKKLFVASDRAVVYSSLAPVEQPPRFPFYGWGWGGWYGRGECTYGYDCEFTGDGRRLKVTVFDIADRASPTVVREIEFSGSYLNSRRIGDLVHTVVVFPETIVPEVEYWPPALAPFLEQCIPIPFTDEELRAMFEDLRVANLERITEASAADLLPSVRDTRHEGGEPTVHEDLLQDCEGFYLEPSRDGRGLLSLVSFVVTALEDLDATTIVSKPGAVYGSHDALYVATRHYGWEMEDWYFSSVEDVSEATTVHRFTLSQSGGSTYSGSGVVSGRILNQFSMDEYEGHLRIATTTGRLPSPDVHSTVSVLELGESGLELAGQVGGIAPTEDIRSVRFSSETGYVVTFKKTDPLFVLDLSEPSLPRLRGELHIPGFSTYMHVLDDGHLLSIGYDADDQGDFAWFQGILLQVFDVGDLDNPALIHREVIGTRGSTSDAATNHLAFNYFRPRSLLALPMVICEGGTGGQFGAEVTFSGLLVYRVDLETGFELLGGVPHSDPESGTDARGSCGNWWTNSNSEVKRSIFMDDFVYSIALDQIRVAALEALEQPVAVVALEE